MITIVKAGYRSGLWNERLTARSIRLGASDDEHDDDDDNDDDDGFCYDRHYGAA